MYVLLKKINYLEKLGLLLTSKLLQDHIRVAQIMATLFYHDVLYETSIPGW